MRTIRWSVVVPEATDRALRTHLADQGGKKGDISRFIDEAIQMRLFELTVENVKKRNRARSQKEILAALEKRGVRSSAKRHLVKMTRHSPIS